MKKTIIEVRCHSITDISHLTAQGRQLAHRIGQKLSKIKFSHAGSSSLKKCIETAELFLGLDEESKISVDQRLDPQDEVIIVGRNYLDVISQASSKINNGEKALLVGVSEGIEAAASLVVAGSPTHSAIGPHLSHCEGVIFHCFDDEPQHINPIRL
jgi:phosphohistidine phosphatase SixA